jgi:hypothetical protein
MNSSIYQKQLENIITHFILQMKDAPLHLVIGALTGKNIPQIPEDSPQHKRIMALFQQAADIATGNTTVATNCNHP